VLKKYQLSYQILKGKGLDEGEKLDLLKGNLKRGPIILLVANGQTKKKWFSRRRAFFHWHYVTLR